MGFIHLRVGTRNIDIRMYIAVRNINEWLFSSDENSQNTFSLIRIFYTKIIHLTSIYFLLFEKSNSCMKTSRLSLEIEVALRKEAAPTTSSSQPHRRLLAPFPNPSRRSQRSGRSDRAAATGCEQASDAIDRVTGAT